jgi:GNAT superfamily N-acetyltransferase
VTEQAYRFEPVIYDDFQIRETANLLSAVFPNTDRYTFEYLRWQYFENPDGRIVGYNAYSLDGELAAHYVVQPLKARLCGRVEQGALSLNTATAPKHQGKGLFVKLARLTYNAAQELGYRFIVGVANANSTPGFLRKLNFQLVSPLSVRVGVGHPLAPPVEALDFERLWDDNARVWRMGRPFERYWIRRGLPFAAERSGFRVCLSAKGQWGEISRESDHFSALTVWMGLNPNFRWRGISLSIPMGLRPSPLNFIYLPLGQAPQTLNAGRVAVEPVDFDAY